MHVNNVPSTHTVVMKNQLQQMKNNSETLNKIVSNLERGKYKGTEEGNRLLGPAALIMPQTSQDSLQSATPLIVAAACVNAGIPINVEKVVRSCPLRTTYGALVKDTASEILLQMNATVKQNKRVFLSLRTRQTTKRKAQRLLPSLNSCMLLIP